VNKTKTATLKMNQAWKNLCWMTLLAVLFQSVFITGANAFSIQTSSIYTRCNHLNEIHHDKVQCLQHCASATDHYTQYYLSDTPAPSTHVDSNNPVIIYHNTLENIQTVRLSDRTRLFKPQQYYASDSAIYLTTSRLRI